MALEKETLAKYKQAGKILADAISYGKTLIKVDANALDVLQKIEERIQNQGAGLAFPAQVAMNQVAAHWCPEPNDPTVFNEGDIVKLDCGAHIDGHIADMAVSVDLSDDKRHTDLINAAADARDAALKLMTPGRTLNEIGQTIQDIITSAGFSPIKNLSGHGLGLYNVHVPPSVPNIATGDTTQLVEDMVLAVEPFATPGQGKVHEQNVATLYGVANNRPVRGRFARQALNHIPNNLPFSQHWLAGKMGVGQAKLALRELTQAGIIDSYPPLVEVSGKIVSQAEHSVIVADKPIVFTRDV